MATTKYNPEALRFIDREMQSRKASDVFLKTQKAVTDAHLLPSRITMPFLGQNPFSKRNPLATASSVIPLSLAGYAAGSTPYASSVLAGMADLGHSINPTMVAKNFLHDAENFGSLYKGSLSLATLPYTKLINAAGGAEVLGPLAKVLPFAGSALAPLAAALVARGGYNLYSKLGQTRRLNMLAKALAK